VVAVAVQFAVEVGGRVVATQQPPPP
jgi:hypothetical protein